MAAVELKKRSTGSNRGRGSRPAVPSVVAWLRHPLVASAAIFLGVLLLCSYTIPVPRQMPDFRTIPEIGRDANSRAPSPPTVSRWQDLLPAPSAREMELLRQLRAGQSLSDDDPRAIELFAELQAAGDAAPANPEVRDAHARIPGYVVPLERKGDQLHEFLLVPYYGACIHAPPPPANQVIHVVASKPLTVRSMDAVWVRGTLQIGTFDGTGTTARYRVADAEVTSY